MAERGKPQDEQMAATQADEPEEAPAHIPHEERLKLWVSAGGRCAVCNKYLLKDEFTQRPFKLGEMAHNVGRKRSSRSPRGMDELPVAERNKAENLLLLCGDHHELIDEKVARGDYTVEALRKIKARHEDRVRYLTGLGEDAETVVLRAVGEVRGAAVELSEERVSAAVRNAGPRYPRYGLNYGGADIEIDLRGLPDEGSERYWQSGLDRINEVAAQIADAVARNRIRHLSVFGFCRIPFLAAIGYALDDKVPAEIFQKQRGGDEAWEWDPEAEPVEFELTKTREGDLARVALCLSLSGSVDLDKLPAACGDATVWTIAPVGREPSRDLFRARATLDRFTETYHGFLDLLGRQHSDAEAIDVFPAVPISAAIALGRGVMRTVQPALRMHELEGDQYEFALELNR